MSSVTLSIVAEELLSASELSKPARRLGADLLGSAAGAGGVVTEAPDEIGARAGVSWNRARVLLGELAAAGFLVYWSYTAARRRWCHVSFLAWSVGAPRAVPPAAAGETFGDPVGDQPLTRNVSGDAGRSGEIGDHDHDQSFNDDSDHDHDQPLTRNVSGDADRIVALLTDAAVGLNRSTAERFADEIGDLALVYGHVCQWQRDCAASRRPVGNPAGLLFKRLSCPEKFSPARIEDVDRSGHLWDRYMILTQNVSGDASSPDNPQTPAVLTQNVLGDAPDQDDPQVVAAAAVWRQLQSELAIEQGGSFDRWVHDTWVIAYEDGEFLIGLPDAFRYDWIVHRLSRQIKRKLSVIMGRSTIDVKFRVQPRPQAGVC